MKVERFVSSVRVETVGGHDHVKVWIRGQSVGELVVGAGDGAPLAALLEFGRIDPDRLAYPPEAVRAVPAAAPPFPLEEVATQLLHQAFGVTDWAGCVSAVDMGEHLARAAHKAATQLAALLEDEE